MLYGTTNLRERRQIYDLLGGAARHHWEMNSLPEIERDPEGKPHFPVAEDRQFNLSHSGIFGLCALSEQPVGVDVQVIKQWRPALIQRVCAPEELEWLNRQPDQWHAFATLWVMKESRVKQSGRGLREPIREIRVPLPEGEQRGFRLDGLWFRLYQGDGWLASVCGLEEPPEEIIWLDDTGA